MSKKTTLFETAENEAKPADRNSRDVRLSSALDFDALAARRVDPPLVPAISSALDAENFNADACDEDTGVAPFEGDQTIYDDWSEGYVQFPAPGPDA